MQTVSKAIRSVAIALLVSIAAAAQTEAANHYVRQGATGNASGSDWTNAYTNLPTTLTRGDIYYLAAGSYGSHTFNDAVNGTTLITIIKATPADHGTATGWSDTYGGGQAVFSHWNIYTDYYFFNGVSRDANWRSGALGQYGIRVAGTDPVRLDNAAGTGADNVTFQYIDFKGGGRDTGAGDDVIYGLTGNSNLTFRYCALHDSDRTIFLMRGTWRNLVVDQSYLARNTSTPATHGEMLSMTSSDTVTFSNNHIEDIEGTAVWAGLNDGTASNWKIYGNEILHTAAYWADTGRVSGHNDGIAGIVYVANDASNNNFANNFLIYNNTIYKIKGTFSGVVIQAGSGNVVQNNLWYGSVRTGTDITGTIGYNWYFQTTADGDASSTKVVCSTNCSVFVDPANNNFRLAFLTPGGLSLAAPFNVDPMGAQRGADGVWDRGAYEFVSNVPAPPAAPTNLRIIR